jgi:hypothetical protein
VKQHLRDGALAATSHELYDVVRNVDCLSGERNEHKCSGADPVVFDPSHTLDEFEKYVLCQIRRHVALDVHVRYDHAAELVEKMQQIKECVRIYRTCVYVTHASTQADAVGALLVLQRLRNGGEFELLEFGLGKCTFPPTFATTEKSWEWITRIGRSAFTSAQEVPDLTGLKNLTTIGDRAFFNARGAPNLRGLANLTTIGRGAFFNARGAPTLSGLVNLTTIGERAFISAEGTPNLSGLAKLTTIGDYAFVAAKGTPILNGLTSLTTIGRGAFYNALAVPDFTGLTSLTTIEYCAFYSAEGKVTLRNLPNLTTIEPNAFYSVAEEERSNVPKLTNIGDWAFGNGPVIS